MGSTSTDTTTRRTSRATRIALVLGMGAVFAVPARAGDDVVLNGWLAARAQGTLVSEGSLSSTKDLPMAYGLAEANVQARARLLDRRLSVHADLSLFAQSGFGFVDDGVEVEDHDVEEDHPRIVLSELYVHAELLEHLDLSVGKMRVVWGAGIANNPTDVLNPARDPTDPGFQRAGIWQLKLDVPLDKVTWSAFFAPAVLATEASLPVAMFAWPSYEIRGAGPRDDEVHWAAGARLYALVAETDLNLWMVWSNLSGDAFEDKTRLMASASRLVGDEVEIHGEVMFQTGAARLYANPSCAVDEAALFACARAGVAPLATSKLADPFIFPRALVGFRWLPADESILTVEYLYAADGLDDDELGAAFSLQTFVRDAERSDGSGPSFAPTTAAAEGVPSRVGFDVLRRNTLFVNYTKPRILDDFTFSGGVVVTVDDLSSLLSLSLTWAAQDWLQLQALAFAPLPSVARLLDKSDGVWPSAPLVNDVVTGAFDGAPFSARAVVEARVFF